MPLRLKGKMMPKFRKKPVVIEAIQWDGLATQEIFDFMGVDSLEDDLLQGLVIPTLEDGPDAQVKHYAKPGDWIVKGISGEFYPVKDDIFRATYDPA